MSITNIFGIPFRITCCGEAASQFYNPLQESISSDMRATIGGEDPANVARNFLKKTNKTNQYFYNSLIFHHFKQVFCMLRTVKLMALVAMFFVALTAGAQVATSASGVVPAENCVTGVLYTPSNAKNNTMTNIDGHCAIWDESPGICSSNEVHPQSVLEDGDIKEMSGIILGVFALLVVSCVFITAILKGKNIKIKCSDIDITIDDSKRQEEEQK